MLALDSGSMRMSIHKVHCTFLGEHVCTKAYYGVITAYKLSVLWMCDRLQRLQNNSDNNNNNNQIFVDF